MPRLRTPVQYEESMGELNQVRPLNLIDPVKIALDIPFLNFNPVNKNRPAIGKLVRCNKAGALIKENSVIERNTEIDGGGVTTGTPVVAITFSQPVHYWRMWGIGTTLGSDLWLTDSTGDIIIQTLDMLGDNTIFLYGDTFYVKGAGTPFWIITFTFTGYY